MIETIFKTYIPKTRTTSQVNRSERVVIIHFSPFEFQRCSFIVVGVADEIIGIEGGGHEEFEKEIPRPQALGGGGGRGRGEEIGTRVGAQIESF